jgi:hypothetical protein
MTVNDGAMLTIDRGHVKTPRGSFWTRTRAYSPESADFFGGAVAVESAVRSPR